MEMPDEIKQIALLYPNQTVFPVTLSLWNSSAETPEGISLALCIENREIVFSKETYWEAFCAIRAELEKEGILACCHGASRNVYPSGTCLSMGTGSLAYRTQLGQPARTADLVNIFDTGPDVDPVTLAEQEDFHSKWLGFFREAYNNRSS